ncbi:hypothetical protein [Embleya sp. MST-111070]|uniref:hypothetical protein n=1 Tax=Embleya sp. MST-111070 TaxID=3398231 RepID=UPI003F73503C
MFTIDPTAAEPAADQPGQARVGAEGHLRLRLGEQDQPVPPGGDRAQHLDDVDALLLAGPADVHVDRDALVLGGGSGRPLPGFAMPTGD